MKTKTTKTTKAKSKKTTKATKTKSKKVTKEMKTTKSVKKELSKKVRKKVTGGSGPGEHRTRHRDSVPCGLEQKCPYKNNVYACTLSYGYECVYRTALGIHW